MNKILGCLSKKDCAKDLSRGIMQIDQSQTTKNSVAILNSKGIQRIDYEHGEKNLLYNNNEKFENKISHLKGQAGIAVVRKYGNNLITSNSTFLGNFGVITISKIKNVGELRQKFLQKKKYSLSINYISTTELVAQLIVQKESFVEGLIFVQESIKGFCTIILLSADKKCIYVSKDKIGYSMLFIGEREDAIAVSSSKKAIFNTETEYELERELQSGEIVRIANKQCKRLKKIKSRQFYSFIWDSYGSPVNDYQKLLLDKKDETHCWDGSEYF